VEDTYTVLAANRTGFGGTLQAEKYSIYPNPFSSEIHIQGQESFQAALFDATGKELLRTQEAQGNLTIDLLQAFPKGIYFLHLENNEGRRVYRIVKE